MKDVYVQWFRGEHAKSIEKLKFIEGSGSFMFAVFESGRRCNLDLIANINDSMDDANQKYMGVIPSKDGPLWGVDERQIPGTPELRATSEEDGIEYIVSPAVPDTLFFKVYNSPNTLIPTPNVQFEDYWLDLHPELQVEANKNDDVRVDGVIFDHTFTAPEPETIVVKPEPEIIAVKRGSIQHNTSSPVYLLKDLIMQCDKKCMEGTIYVDMNLPSVEIISMLQKNFSSVSEDEFINIIISMVNVEIIASALKDSLREIYFNHN